MTTIAYDGVMLAGDRLANDNGIPTQCTKIHVLCEGSTLAGCSGDTQDKVMFLKWIDAGQPADKKPKVEDSFRAITVERDTGKAFLYEFKLEPVLIEDDFYAIGSGRDFAWTAMSMGMSARDAVNKAAEFDIFTGNGCDMVQVYQGG